MLKTVRGDRPTVWWWASWMLPAVIGVLAIVTLETWLPELAPDPFYADIDAEHAAVCRKLGLEPSLEQFSVCRSELRELRSRDARWLFFL